MTPLPFHGRPLIYLAGPYTSPDPVRNTHDTIQAAERLHETELVTCHVPHLSLLWHIVSPHDDVEFWYSYDLAVLKRCDALLRLPGKSSGADREVDFALGNHIPVWKDENALIRNVREHWIEAGVLSREGMYAG